VLVAGGRLVDPAERIDAVLDVRIRNGTIVEIGEHLMPERDEEVIDASGAYVAPGFIDMHVHLREPGNPEKETVATGTAAAVAGGFTAVAAMPNTNPAIDTPDLIRLLCHGEVSNHPEPVEGPRCRIHPIAAITKGRDGRELVDFAKLSDAGAVAFSDDGNTIMDPAVQARAAVDSGKERLFITHCEDERLKAAGFTDLAESVTVARDALMSARYGKRWHIAHVSTSAAADVVRWIRADARAPLTCEVTPHHLVFTGAFLEEHGGRGKVNPPLQAENDARAMRDAVRDGTIDAFATDHAPHTEEEKARPVEHACVGFSGLEVAVGAYAYAIPDLPLTRFVELLSTNPARILRVPGGTLATGAPADMTVFADREWSVDTRRFQSKGKSTPFSRMRLPRRVLTTIVGGKVMYRE
jgi:dihydroorotase